MGARAVGRLRCASCNCWTTDPFPSPSELSEAYAGTYRPADGRFSGPGDAVLRRLRARLAGRLDRIAPPGPILDVGAGAGALVEALGARGRESLGIDPHSQHPEMRTMALEEVDGDWAAVVFWHSLEHVPAAGEALDQAISLLAPRGVIVIAMPNPDSVQAALFGERWLALDPPRHLVHVPAATLIDRLRERGLAVERLSHLRGGQVVFGWLHGLVGALPGHVDLYDAIRRPEARSKELSKSARFGALAAATLTLPLAVAAVGFEAAIGRGGTVYVEARRV